MYVCTYIYIYICLCSVLFQSVDVGFVIPVQSVCARCVVVFCCSVLSLHTSSCASQQSYVYIWGWGRVVLGMLMYFGDRDTTGNDVVRAEQHRNVL